jgi:uncharacterized membrane protein
MAAEQFESEQRGRSSSAPGAAANGAATNGAGSAGHGAQHEAQTSVAQKNSPAEKPLERIGSRLDNRLGSKVRNGVTDRQLVQALGWFSVGLGLVEVLAPRKFGRAIGVGEHSSALPLLGVREIANGIGLLSGRQSDKWTWARVAGDAMDLAVLASAMRSTNARPGRIALAAAAVGGVTALDVYAGRQLSRSAPQQQTPLSIDVNETIAVNASPAAVYAFWRNLENLALFMDHVQSVTSTGARSSHWVVRAPAGTTVEWDAEITHEEPDRQLSWRTLEHATVQHEGTVKFDAAPGGRGTLVKVSLRYRPPAGVIGAQVAKLFGEEPSQQIRADLRRLKQLIETGEVATTQGQPSGKRSLLGRATLGRLWS